VDLIGNRLLDDLLLPGRPADDGFVDLGVFTESEVKPTLILGGVTARRDEFLQLLLAVPINSDPRADGASIALCSREIKADPIRLRRDSIAVEQQRPPLVGRQDVEGSVVIEVGQSDGPVLLFGIVTRPCFIRHYCTMGMGQQRRTVAPKILS